MVSSEKEKSGGVLGGWILRSVPVSWKCPWVRLVLKFLIFLKLLFLHILFDLHTLRAFLFTTIGSSRWWAVQVQPIRFVKWYIFFTSSSDGKNPCFFFLAPNKSKASDTNAKGYTNLFLLRSINNWAGLVLVVPADWKLPRIGRMRQQCINSAFSWVPCIIQCAFKSWCWMSLWRLAMFQLTALLGYSRPD